MAEAETFYAARKGSFMKYISESQTDTYIANGYEVAKFTREILGGGSESTGTSATAKASTKSTVAAAATSDETSETETSSDESSEDESET